MADHGSPPTSEGTDPQAFRLTVPDDGDYWTQGTREMDRPTRNTTARMALAQRGAVLLERVGTMQKEGKQTKPGQPVLGIAARTESVFDLRGIKVSEDVRMALERFDVDHDEQLDVGEVTALVEHLMKHKQRNRYLVRSIIALVIFTCLVLAAMFGLTWAVVYALKDTKVDKMVMVTMNGDVVRTGSIDMLVDGSSGLMVPRAAPDLGANSSIVLSTSVTNTVRTAQFAGSRLPFTSNISTALLMELNYLMLQGDNGAEVALKVTGVARVPKFDSYWGTVLRIITSVGTITVDDDEISFSSTIASVFDEMNLTSIEVSGGRRRLLASKAKKGAEGLFQYVDMNNLFVYPADMDPSEYAMRGVAKKSQAKSKSQKMKKMIDQDDNGDSAGDASLRALWSQWKRDFIAQSTDQQHDNVRYTTWKKNMKTMNSINLDDSKEFWAAGNRFFDKTEEELFETLIRDNKAPNEPEEYVNPDDELQGARRSLLQAPSINWCAADRGKCTPIKDQAGCGNCWSMSSTAAVESAYLIATNTTYNATKLDLSEAQTTFCCYKAYPTGCTSSNRCGGGSAPEALNYMGLYGITVENNYPFSQAALAGTNEVCKWTTGVSNSTGQIVKLQPLATGKSYTRLTSQSVSALKTALNSQPVVVYWNVGSDFWWYAGGIYAGTCTTSVNHAMVAVGYDTSGPTPYWIIRNSWGTSWAEGGYVRVKMSTTNGAGQCGMQLYMYQPPLAFNTKITKK